MKDIELLLPRVLEKAPACPEPTALRHLRDAAIEFCRRTRIWRSSDDFTIAAEDDCETVAAPQGAVIYEITNARFVATPEDDEEEADATSGTDLEAVTIDWLDKERPGWRDEEGSPIYLTQSAPDTVRVVPKPEDGGTLTLELILLPTIDAEQVPDVLIDSYSREIADGAIGSVLLLPAEFGNPELGALHAGLFERALGRFADRIPRGQQRAKRRTRPAPNF